MTEFPSLVGKTVSHYRILEKIGAGGMGDVYRAHDERLERDVAFKVLSPGTLSGEAARKRFRKEALALSKLNHPNIATVHDFDTQDGVDFLIMEYVAGETLSERLHGAALPEAEVLRLGMQLADGLASAHAQGIIHRDLKPANTRLTTDGRLKILDFGLAKLMQSPIDQPETAETASMDETRGPVGTLPFMAPEQLRGDPVDGRTDIWSAGVLLYKLATGRSAFPEGESARLIASILTAAPAPPRVVNQAISPGLENILLKCLEKDPEDRYQSAKELAVDLRRLLTPSAAIQPIPKHGFDVRKKIFLAAAAAVLLLLTLILALKPHGVRDKLFGEKASAPIRSLAVLPLENLSNDPEQEFFADGMTDELITTIAKIGQLRVISRTSVMQYKGTRKPVSQIARELNVDGIVEGTVLRSGNRVRISAQLIDAKSERHLWAETYERDLRDVLALQSDVGQAIAREVRIRLTPQEQTGLVSARQVNPEAHEAYLKGRYFLNKRAGDALKKSEIYFRQAIDKDPNDALAYAGLADLYRVLGSWEGEILPPNVAFLQSKSAAQKALELDSTLAEVHTSLGYVKLYYDWDWAGAESEFKRAIRLNPNSEDAHHGYSHYLLMMGRTEKSLEESKRALELAPFSPLLDAHLSWHYCFSRQYDLAIQQSRSAMDVGPAIFATPLFGGWALEQESRYPDAIAWFQQAAAISGGNTAASSALGHVYGISGDKANAEKILTQLKELSTQRFVSAYDIAMVYLGIGKQEETFQWLEKAYEERSSWMTYLNLDPRLDGLRSDPRFRALVQRVGLPQ
jgi:eukaryotic-like serine/threonine-protein kinase